MVCISDCFRNNYGDIATAVRTNYRMVGNGLLCSPPSNSVCFNADAMATVIKGSETKVRFEDFVFEPPQGWLAVTALLHFSFKVVKRLRLIPSFFLL